VRVPDGGFEHLGNQGGHVPEARNHLGRVIARNMNDLRNVEIELEAIGRSNRNGGQIGVQPVRFGLAGRPVENHVGRGHIRHLVGVRIDRILAWIQRFDPHALLTAADQIPVLEGVARDVLSFLAYEGDDDSHMGDRHFGHGDHFDGREARVDEVAAREQHLLLQALAAFAVDERLRALKHIMAVDHRPGDLAGSQ
jgi:hypothetical protein